MTDKELQELISLKKYEQPEEGYFDDFLVEFQQRQRSEMLQTSARGLLLERAKAWFSEFGSMRWVMGAGVAYAAVALVFHFTPSEESGQSGLAEMTTETENVDDVSSLTIQEGEVYEVTPVSMVFTDPVDFSAPAPAFVAEERIF